MTAPFVLIEPVVEEVRIYPDGPPTRHCQRYGQALMLYRRHCEPGAGDLAMASAHTPHTRATLRALRDKLTQHGLHTVYGMREFGHAIPGAREVSPGVWQVQLRP